VDDTTLLFQLAAARRKALLFKGYADGFTQAARDIPHGHSMLPLGMKTIQTTKQGGNLFTGNLLVHGFAGKRRGEHIGIFDGMQQSVVKTGLK